MLRDFQSELKRGVYQCWGSGDRNVLAVAPTGSGKTVVFSDILTEYNAASVAVAHRQELVSQISLALARNSVRHGILAPKKVIRNIVAIHMDELGRSWYEPQARTRVAGVDTLNLHDPTDVWLKQVGLWVMDEGHHVLQENKWGKSVRMFPNAFGLGVTATPIRADGKGLGKHADGVFDSMVVGPTMRSLIVRGYLTPYRVFAPPNDLDLSGVNVSAGGDYSPEPLRKAVHRSKQIVGDVVKHYLRIARGKLGVTFAVDIDSATEIAQAFRDAGVPAEIVSSKTPDTLRMSILRRFARREILQLVNVDLFGEGFDLPAIEVVSFARPTMSFSLFCQQFGRALRLMITKELSDNWHLYTDEQRVTLIAQSMKPTAIIIDHVGNVYHHSLPDAHRTWSLDRRERGATVLAPLPVRICLGCTGAYERILGPICPYCSHEHVPGGRTLPSQVDGDLFELLPEVLEKMRGEIDRIDSPPFMGHLSGLAAAGLANRHEERKQAQQSLRMAMMLWGGTPERWLDTRLAQREFFLRFGVDVASAMALGRPDAEALEAKIRRAS